MLSTKIITRSKNQSVVASASYRSNEELYSKEDNEYKRFKERSVDPVSFIMKPDHAPEWTLDREQLWNEVQEKEDRNNSRLAREVLVALPVELDEDQQEEMLREFVEESFVEDGMVADVSIHRDKEHNPHAHIMLTVRPFNEHGEWDMKKKREYLFNENGENILKENGEKKFKTISSTNWNDLDTLKKWRENYAEKINNYFKSFDIDAEVSHKSYEDQGIEKRARHRLKQNEYFFEKREKERAKREGYDYEPLTYYAKLNRMIDRKEEKLKEIDNKLYSLSKEKQLLSKDYTTIRSEHPLSESSSYRFIEKRIGGEVNYQSSLNNLNKLEKWNKALEFQTSKLLSEREVINKAMNVLQKEPKKVLIYGFIVQGFDEQLTDKVNQFKETQSELEKKTRGYLSAYELAKSVHENEIDILNKQFKFLYPDYSESLNSNDKDVLGLKSKYVNEYESTGIIKDKIPEFETEINRYSDGNINAHILLRDWKENQADLSILNSTNSKVKTSYSEMIRNNYDKDNVYNKAIEYTNVRNSLLKKEKQINNMKQKINDLFMKIHPKVKDEKVDSLNMRFKTRSIENYLNTGKVIDIEKSILSFEKNQDKNNEHSNHIGGGEGQLIDSLTLMGGSSGGSNHENEIDDKELKRIRKKKKAYKDIEHEK
ncbi:MobQ family relaxase [Salipaludibacillus sp. CF4.18]|uniref:MobQ family relaxase n=1 Tax=Salipaludibacillus sp. CF4.18 TaxID=3373081 RepID=UPI003EE47D66